MKALTDRLEWLKLYINGELGDRADPKNIQMMQDVWIETYAIAEALPDIELPAIAADRSRTPPERIIELPEEKP
jgi:hypothetical protein